MFYYFYQKGPYFAVFIWLTFKLHSIKNPSKAFSTDLLCVKHENLTLPYPLCNLYVLVSATNGTFTMRKDALFSPCFKINNILRSKVLHRRKAFMHSSNSKAGQSRAEAFYCMRDSRVSCQGQTPSFKSAKRHKKQSLSTDEVLPSV